jgi:hypothetical protein
MIDERGNLRDNRSPEDGVSDEDELAAPEPIVRDRAWL